MRRTSSRLTPGAGSVSSDEKPLAPTVKTRSFGVRSRVNLEDALAAAHAVLVRRGVRAQRDLDPVRG